MFGPAVEKRLNEELVHFVLFRRCKVTATMCVDT